MLDLKARAADGTDAKLNSISQYNEETEYVQYCALLSFVCAAAAAIPFNFFFFFDVSPSNENLVQLARLCRRLLFIYEFYRECRAPKTTSLMN